MIAISLKRGKFEAGFIGRGLEGFQRRAAVELQPSGVSLNSMRCSVAVSLSSTSAKYAEHKLLEHMDE